MNTYTAAKRLLPLLLSLVLIFSCFSISSAEDTAPSVISTFISNNSTLTNLVSGRVMVPIRVSASGEVRIVLTVGYYDTCGTLLDFSSKCVTSSALCYLYITVPSSVSGGQYLKVFAINLENMQPLEVQNSTLVRKETVFTGIDTEYSGLSERYYTLNSASGSLSVNGRTIGASSSGTPLRLKDMSGGEYAFEDITQPRYRLRFDAESGNVDMYYYSAGSASQRWILEEYGSGYTIAQNDKYLAVKDGKIALQDEKFEWSLELYSETPFSLMTSLDGFKLLTEAQKQRVIEICTSIGADVFPSAVTNGSSWLDKCEASFLDLYYERSSTSAEEQRDKILEIVSAPIFSYLVDYYTMEDYFPGCAEDISQTEPVKTKHIMWDLVEVDGNYYSDNGSTYIYDATKPINCYLISVTYKNASSSQTVNVYCTDPDFDNVQTAIEAFGRFPYNYRKHIENIYVYAPTNSESYNCGASELFVRLKSAASVKTIMSGIAHELGHSADYNANGNPGSNSSHWSQGSAWQSHVSNDIATISSYGSSNYYEGLAEFSRLYFFCYNNRDLQIAIEQLYPNRFASFGRMLAKLGGVDMY